MRQGKPFALFGPWADRLASLWLLTVTTLAVGVRHLVRRPTLPAWPYQVDVAHTWLKEHMRRGFELTDASGEGIAASREYLDSLVFYSPALDRVSVSPATSPVSARWFTPRTCDALQLLYLHGGGYAYNARSHANLIALVAEACAAPTLVPDYRLIPEHPWPAQLEDAIEAYDWMLAEGADPRHLAVAGDSAGGHLALSLCVALKRAGRPLPACAACIGPWTDTANSGASMLTNQRFDWVEKRMAERWSAWLGRRQPNHPLISPLQSVTGGLPPLLLHVGSHEILHDMVLTYGAAYRAAGNCVLVQEWKDMTHDFHAFGDLLAPSREALQAIGRFVREHCG